MFQRFIEFLDDNEWACWVGMAVGSSIVLVIDSSNFYLG